MNIGDTFSQDVDNVVFGRIETQAAPSNDAES